MFVSTDGSFGSISLSALCGKILVYRCSESRPFQRVYLLESGFINTCYHFVRVYSFNFCFDGVFASITSIACTPAACGNESPR